jgi:hypothetical protein
MNTLIYTMNWNNAQKDKLPLHEQEVLVSVDGIYYITTYDSSQKIFRLKESPETFFTPEEKVIYWTDIS